MAAPVSSASSSPPTVSRYHPALWLVPLVAAVALVLWDAFRQAQHFRQVSANYRVAVRAPLPDAASPTGFADGRRHVAYPARWVDGQHWIVQTQQMLADGGLRVRAVNHDNAPHGRSVHWSSPFRWWLALCAWVDHTLTGRSLASAVETAAFYANPLLLAALLLTLVPCVSRRFGAAGAALLALGLAGSPALRVLFAPDNPDHHGAIQLCAMAALFFLLSGGAGWVRREDRVFFPQLPWLPSPAQARRAFTCSAVAGGIGLWISAVSMVPVFLGIAAGGLVCAGIGRRENSRTVAFDSSLWRRWGVIGSATAFFAYLIEYFPSHLGWRLEVNHPLYALAWLGGGEVLARATAWLSGRLPSKSGSPVALAAAVVALIAPAMVIALAGPRVFVVSDPFLWSLSHDYTPEFRSLSVALRYSGWNVATVASCLPMLLVPLGLIALIVGRSRPPRLGAALLALPLTATALFWAMAFKELRWWTVGHGFLLGVIALASMSFATGASRLRRIASFAIVAAAFVPGLFLLTQATAQRSPIDLDDVLSLAERDLAHSLRQRVGDAPLVVLSGPATTSRMIYFASARGLGTPYWENLDGLKRAAEILAAPTAEEAHRLIRASGITHLVFVSWDDFVEPYVRLARGLRPHDPLREPAFGLDLLRNSNVPSWLERIPDHLPSIPALAGESVLIFEVTDRTAPEQRLVRTVRSLLYRGRLDDARNAIPELRRFSDNLAIAVARARTELAAQNRPGLDSALADVDRLLHQRQALDPEDRMDLIGLLALSGRTADARSLLEEALPHFDAPALRRLTPGSLAMLLRLTQNLGIRWPDTRLRGLAVELLPPDGRI